MRARTNVMTVLAILGCCHLNGCANLLPTVPVTVGLSSDLGRFEVQAGVPSQTQGTFGFTPSSDLMIGRGSLTIDPSAISFTPADTAGGKVGPRLQGEAVLNITIWVAREEDLDNVFDDPTTSDKYTLAATVEGGAVTNIEAEETSLKPRTLQLLNEGIEQGNVRAAIGLRVVSSIDGTVQLDSLIFNLGL